MIEAKTTTSLIKESDMTIAHLLGVSQRKHKWTMEKMAAHVSCSEAAVKTWLQDMYIPYRKYHKEICEVAKIELGLFQNIWCKENKRRKVLRLQQAKRVKTKVVPIKKSETSKVIELAVQVSLLDSAQFNLFMDIFRPLSTQLNLRERNVT